MYNNISLKELNIFVKIAETSSLTDAASRLNISPSSVSKHLTKLEEKLSVTLFLRTTRNIVLTESGHFLYEESRRFLQDFEALYNSTKDIYNHPQGTLKVSTSIAFAHAHFIDFAHQYLDKYPEVNLIIDLSDNFTKLNESDIDIALRISKNAPTNYNYKILANINWVYCASTEYIKKNGTPRTFEDLKQHSNLVYPGISPISNTPEFNKGIIKPRLLSNSSLILLKSVLIGKGIAYLPTYLVSSDIKNGSLIPIRLDNHLLFNTHKLYALYLPRKHINPKIQHFIGDFIEKIGDKPYWEEWINNFEI